MWCYVKNNQDTKFYLQYIYNRAKNNNREMLQIHWKFLCELGLWVASFFSIIQIFCFDIILDLWLRYLKIISFINIIYVVPFMVFLLNSLTWI